MDSEMSRKISRILYMYPIPVFGGFVQFQTKYITDEASIQEMFSMYIESHTQMSFIEFDSEEEFESNYEVVGPNRVKDQGDGIMEANVTDVANALVNKNPFEKSSFMQTLDLEVMHALEFPEYMNAAVVVVEIPMVANGEFAMGMEFSFREAIIMAMKNYNIRRGVDYRVYESKSLTFYTKCTQYGSGCDWLIRVSMISRKWYNGNHTCTRATISQDHSKLDSNTIVEAIKPLVEADPSIKVNSVITEVQSKFNYTINYQKAWLVKQKSLEKIFGGWNALYEVLPIWFETMCHKEPSIVVHFEIMHAYQGDDLVTDIEVDGTHLSKEYLSVIKSG
ncbi:hypothetical protein Ahy_B06g079976 [Arachis hypogaea]|uniref:Uncharacterized protein n=1 Tax=Arachis hypogaea TaxID=3818 RepID=A0A444YGV3_ARAHY|nr:hypothetical protein Ahy_B06g079976 [Arachis hypogaea]